PKPSLLSALSLLAQGLFRCHPRPGPPGLSSLVPCRVFPSINQSPILRCLVHPHSFLHPLPFLYTTLAFFFFLFPSLLLLTLAHSCHPHLSPDLVFSNVEFDILSPPSRILPATSNLPLLRFSTCASSRRERGLFVEPI
ncbi:hypothetical protein CORC01_03217, partial [Colletotrichum orchidophilum]